LSFDFAAPLAAKGKFPIFSATVCTSRGIYQRIIVVISWL